MYACVRVYLFLSAAVNFSFFLLPFFESFARLHVYPARRVFISNVSLRLPIRYRPVTIARWSAVRSNTRRFRRKLVCGHRRIRNRLINSPRIVENIKTVHGPLNPPLATDTPLIRLLSAIFSFRANRDLSAA